jgi:hypothetical protein
MQKSENSYITPFVAVEESIFPLLPLGYIIIRTLLTPMLSEALTWDSQ